MWVQCDKVIKLLMYQIFETRIHLIKFLQPDIFGNIMYVDIAG